MGLGEPSQAFDSIWESLDKIKLPSCVQHKLQHNSTPCQTQFSDDQGDICPGVSYLVHCIVMLQQQRFSVPKTGNKPFLSEYAAPKVLMPLVARSTGTHDKWTRRDCTF